MSNDMPIIYTTWKKLTNSKKIIIFQIECKFLRQMQYEPDPQSVNGSQNTQGAGNMFPKSLFTVKEKNSFEHQTGTVKKMLHFFCPSALIRNCPQAAFLPPPRSTLRVTAAPVEATARSKLSIRSREGRR